MKKNKLKIASRFAALAVFAHFIFVAFSLTASAQQAKPAPAASAQKAPTLMWKATGANGKTVYLLGSIHLGAKDFYPMATEIENAFEQSNKLLVEADLGKTDAAAMQKMILANGLYVGDDTLFKHLSPAATEQLKKFAVQYNLPAENLAKLKPWLVGMTIAGLPLTKSGYNAEYGVDKYFLDRARGKKQIVEIESADWQIKLLSGESDENQIKYLESTLAQVGQIGDSAQKLMTAYRSGDPQRLEAVITDSSGASNPLQKKLLDDRNPRMTDFAEQCLKTTEDRCFVVVGAAHLVGKKGVVQMLKNRGYKVEQTFVQPAKKS